MCGIAGIVNHRNQPRAGEIIERMNSAQIHRGPDGAGIFVDDSVALGHRRLSVIDLATGDQPIKNEDGSILVVFNGEIYNYRKLRDQLTARGHVFTTKSDTEVIVHLYEEYGSDFVPLLDGMFAFAVYNQKTRRVLLARDRAGQKPLLYFMHNNTLVFSSELPALECHPEMPRELDHDALSDYLSLQYIPGPQTVYRGVKKLPPAHQLEYRLDDGNISIRNYRRLDFSMKFDGTPEDAAAELRSLLEKAVRKRLMADVPLGTFLSGGVDSTIVTGLAAQQRAPQETAAFTIGFDDEAYDERHYAARAAETIRTATGGALRHEVRKVDPNDFKLVETLAAHCGEPFADASILPTALLSRFARETVTVALSGDGADELFCGYERYLAMRYAAKLDFLPKPFKSRLHSIAAKASGAGGERTFSGRLNRFLKSAATAPRYRYFNVLDRCEPGLKRELLGIAMRDTLHRHSRETFESFEWHLTARDRIERLNELDYHTYLPGDILPKVDIASMAASLEVRSPFLDKDVVRFAATLPPEYKLQGRSRKHILREAFSDILPSDIAARPKKGFGVPVARFLREEWRLPVRELLSEGAMFDEGYIDRDTTGRLLREHMAGHRDQSYILWNLVILAMFFNCRRNRE